MRKAFVAISLAGMMVLSVGCKSNQGKNAEEEAKLQAEEQGKQIADLQRQLQATKAQRDEALRQMQDMERQPPAAAQPATSEADNAAKAAGIETGRTAEGYQCLRIGDEILFSPGHAEIRKGGEATLKKVAELIRSQHQGHTIRVDGHTDNDPIHKSAKIFQDNWHLSAMRALNVMRFLIQQGVDANKVYVAGFGESRPLEPNDSKGHKAKNRRVEVVVVD